MCLVLPYALLPLRWAFRHVYNPLRLLITLYKISYYYCVLFSDDSGSPREVGFHFVSC